MAIRPPIPMTAPILSIPRAAQTTLRCPEDGSLVIQDGQGAQCLRIDWHQGQPTVTLATADLKVLSAGDIAFHCDQFQVSADQDIQLQSHGSLHASANEAMKLQAPEVSIKATLGDLWLSANDFVRALGEKILLNTDTDPDSAKRQAQAFLRKMLGYKPEP